MCVPSYSIRRLRKNINIFTHKHIWNNKTTVLKLLGRGDDEDGENK